ncbi:D-alanyl-D-alanine carboxypeptidase family protein [Aminipila sp.]|uniref:D-alanyl-D-alanine carboxypeptidase family protein n=1 Tax=Aminipila sp. TaxID=2060095 RepID=UPI0028A1680F|nr:D-alanyl-D-alanine carboxypeptidase family protein [Aminipila sp.]
MNSKKNNKFKNSFKIRETKLSAGLIPISIICAAAIGLFILYPLIHNPAQKTSTAACPSISAKQAILMDAATGEVLYERNATSKAYPASTTKIMTALLTIETVEELDSDLTQKVKIPAEAVGVEGSSIYLAPEESVSIEDLLYGLMLRSGNDAATALAIIIGGNQENFIDMMNVRAKEIGCTNTHFLNPSGLFDEGHYTTAADMALIAQTAMKNETFKKIAAAETWEASRDPDKYNYFYNKNKVVHQYEGGNGIKIGYTKASGRTLVASAERNGKQLICVVMGAPDWFNDSYKLMDYGFSLK